MTLNDVLRLLKSHDVEVLEDKTDENGFRTIVFGCPKPAMVGGGLAYSTLPLEPGQTDVSLKEREGLKRHLWHLTTDIFGDDPELSGLLDDDDDEAGSHLHNIVPKSK